MKQTQTIKKEGEVKELLPNTMFRVGFADGRVVLTVPSGKMRRGFMHFLPGDKVIVEMTPYDKERGRIVAKIGKK
jgi:translation initiation factor IF-1